MYYLRNIINKYQLKKFSSYSNNSDVIVNDEDILKYDVIIVGGGPGQNLCSGPS